MTDPNIEHVLTLDQIAEELEKYKPALDILGKLEELEKEIARLRNALRWIRHIAWVHWYGRGFDPQHMGALADLAQAALDHTGTELVDFKAAMDDSDKKSHVQWQRMKESFTIHESGHE